MMSGLRKRVIARHDIKNEHLIKTVQLEGLRVVGDPRERIMRYYSDGIDELFYMDIVASLYGRNSLFDIIEATTRHCFVPLTVGGGLRNIEDARKCQLAGADKFAINTAAIARPGLLKELSVVFGSQAVVLSVEAKYMGRGQWQAYYDNGREPSGKDVIAWIEEASSLGIGEIIVTSVDREGTRKGFDYDLAQRIVEVAEVPVIMSGGFGAIEHGEEILSLDGIDAIAVADALHFDRMTVSEIKCGLIERNISVRPAAASCT